MHFVDIMGCENIKYNVQNILAMHYIVGYELFILMSVWLTGSCGSLLLPSITKSIILHITSPGKKIKFQSAVLNAGLNACILLLYHYKVEKPEVKPP